MSYIQVSVLIHSENSDHSCAPIPLAFQDGILSGFRECPRCLIGPRITGLPCSESTGSSAFPGASHGKRCRDWSDTASFDGELGDIHPRGSWNAGSQSSPAWLLRACS